MSKKINLERTFNPNTLSTAQLLLKFFGTNPYYAMAREIAGQVTYNPIKHPLTEDIINSHLNNEIALGSYQLNKDNTVNWLGWDIDSDNSKKAKEYAEKIISKLQDIPHGVEFSGGKGYHVLIFLTKPMPADKAKHIVEFIRDSQGLPKSGKTHIECFPKQSSLTKNSPMGSLLKIPLGRHPKTHKKSKFVDPLNGWEVGPEISPEQVLTNLVDSKKVLKLLQEDKDYKKQIIELIVPFWTTGERHNIALYLSGYLAHLGWGLQAVEDIIKDIAIASGDVDIHNRVLAVTDTFKAVASGKTVKGFSGLNEVLPGAVLKNISALATKIITPTMVRQIDSIRLQKGPIFQKTRATANIIWMDLREKGELVKTNLDMCYWYSSDTHLLIQLNSLRWKALLFKNYGINPSEAFGRQVTDAITLRAIGEAEIVSIRNRTFWDGETLFVNLGGSIVYKLEGEAIITTYNGDCGHLFKTDQNLSEQILPDFNNPVDIWKNLIEDISFKSSKDAPSSPEEQGELLKAWILAFFFQELMPTKPLLLALGVPGSGKTTAIRRILKVIESPDAEVLEIAADKPDSLRASIASHKLLALDNLEKSKARWLVDTLNRLATGANIELRQLYKTNEIYVLKPDCFVAMTAVNMPFSEETLFSRILPLEMEQLTKPLPEYFLQKQLLKNIQGIWADLLNDLNLIVKSLRSNKTHVPPISNRLADFTVFCKRIESSKVINGEILMRGIRSLVDRQRLILLDSSPFVFVLEQWLNSPDERNKQTQTFQDLFAILEPLARTRKLEWRWDNAASLERHIMAMLDPLKHLYGAQLLVENAKDSSRIKFIV